MSGLKEVSPKRIAELKTGFSVENNAMRMVLVEESGYRMLFIYDLRQMNHGGVIMGANVPSNEPGYLTTVPLTGEEERLFLKMALSQAPEAKMTRLLIEKLIEVRRADVLRLEGELERKKEDLDYLVAL